MIIKIIRYLRRKIAANRTRRIPSYDEKRAILDTLRLRYNCTILVETGTFLGDTIDYFKDRIEKIYSIELSMELANRAKKRFSDNDHIFILQGDSGQVLTDIISQLDKSTIFWLDGHYSSEFYIGDEYFITAKGDKNTPIEKELSIILSMQKTDFVILIDDARLFVGQNDYPTIKKIKKIVAQYSSKYSVFKNKDIIHILPTHQK